MSTTIQTQADLDAALAQGEREFAIQGNGDFSVTIGEVVTFRTYGNSQPRVEAYGNSQPRVVAYDSSQPRVVAYDSSQPRVVAYNSSQPRVVAYNSSQPRVEAYDSSQPRVVAYDSSQPRVVAYNSSQPRVEAYGSSQPRLDAYNSSQPRVVAYDSSQPRVVAHGSSQPRVVAYNSSQPRVEAYGSSQPRVEAYGSSQVSTAGAVAVDVAAGSQVSLLAEPGVRLTGTPAAHLTRQQPTSVEAWCQEWGAPVVDGVVTLYKAVHDDYRSSHGGDYTPGTVPVAADWDGGDRECGGGFHACATPALSWQFDREATRFLAVKVALADIRVPRPTDVYPQKVKFRAACAPCVEVDLDGEPVSSDVAGAAVVEA